MQVHDKALHDPCRTPNKFHTSLNKRCSYFPEVREKHELQIPFDKPVDVLLLENDLLMIGFGSMRYVTKDLIPTPFYIREAGCTREGMTMF